MPASPILFCSHVEELGGAEHVLLDLLQHLDRERFAPHLASPGDGPLSTGARALGVPVHAVPLPGRTRGQKLRAVRRGRAALRRLAAGLDCRLLVANSMIAGYAAVLAQHAGLRTLWHLHIVPRSPIARCALRRAAAVLAPSTAALAAAGVGERGEVVQNGVPDRFFAAAPGGLRQRLGVPVGAPLLGIVGRIDPTKGHATLLQAFAGLDTAPAPHLVIAGGELFTASQPRLGGHAAALRDQVARLGLDARVHWLGEVADTAPVLAELDALVVPSSIPECAPRSIAEAQAVGCPVIATDLGGVPEMLEEGLAGMLVRPDHPLALRHATLRLLGEPVLRAALVEQARARAGRLHRVQVFAERVGERLAALLGAA